jgi:hypothetical protein
MERPNSPFMFPKWYRFQITSALSILYHLCNGIRHLAWDAGYGFEIRDAYRSGYAVLAATGGADHTRLALRVSGLRIRGKVLRPLR